MLKNNSLNNNLIVGYIFCSGLGTRLRPYTEKIPKPIFLKYKDKTFLEINIENMIAEGIDNIIINYSYGYEYFKEITNKYKANILLMEEKQPVGHGKAIHNVVNQIQNFQYLYTTNGDTITQYNFHEFFNLVQKDKIDFAILSNEKTTIPSNLIINPTNNLIGCKMNSKDYFYVTTNGSKQYRNNLGQMIFNIKSILDISDELSNQDFIGLFGENDFAEIMVKNNKEVKTIELPVQKYIGINTIEEYNNFLNTPNA